MLSISNNKLRNLNLNLQNSIEQSNMVNLPVVAVVGIIETFTLNSFAADINSSISNDSKLYLKATEELPKSKRIIVSLENSTVIRRYLKLYHMKFPWVTIK